MPRYTTPLSELEECIQQAVMTAREVEKHAASLGILLKFTTSQITTIGLALYAQSPQSR